MIANLIGGILLIAGGLFPLYFNLNNWWWILGGGMVVWGALVISSSIRPRGDCFNCSPEFLDERIRAIKKREENAK